MKPLAIFITGFLLITLIVSTTAYVPIESHYGVKIKFYDTRLRDSCLANIAQIQPEYLEGVNYIRVYQRGLNKRYSGLYWRFGRNIDLFDSCSMETLIHELAHHCQYKRGDSAWQGSQHIGHFQECEDEIWANPFAKRRLECVK